MTRRSTRTLLSAATAALLCAGLTAPATAATTDERPAPRALAVVVQAEPGSEQAARDAVRAAGGRITAELPVVHGFAATVPATSTDDLRSVPGVRAVTEDAELTPKTYQPALGYDPDTTYGSLYKVAQAVGAHQAFKSGYTGKDIDIAMIDSGVAPVKGLTSGNVIDGPDLSFDSQEPELAHNDSYGHGTHMASILVGRDSASTRGSGYIDQTRFTGIAPDARLVNVKVAASDGGTDVSQVLAAINWVIEHRNRDGLKIRVLSLSYGTDSTQDYRLDPLSYAVEQAWKAGIVVVVAGGNDGSDRTELGMPAQNPYVLAVGAQDTRGTLSTNDDVVPTWATRGSNKRHVDLVAPGVSVHGLRSPNSAIDLENPGARTGTRFLRGSGTSQATAVVAGAAALFLQRYPTATPDEVKRALTQAASAFPNTPEVYRGAGALDVGNALRGAVPNNRQVFEPATGTGELELSRGSTHVVEDDGYGNAAVLTGERDIFGETFDSKTWATLTAAGRSWTGGDWLGRSWTTGGWSSDGWTGRSWTGRSWTGRSWTGRSWTGRSWTGRSWTGDAWDGRSWTGEGWLGRSWTGRSWTGRSWTGGTWQ